MTERKDFLKSPLLERSAPSRVPLKTKLYRLWPRSWRASWEYVPVRKQGRWCPEEDAGWFNRLFFHFVNSLIVMGYSHPLAQEDLWDLARWDESPGYSERFQRCLASTRSEKHPHGLVWLAGWRAFKRDIIVAGILRTVQNTISLVSPYILELLLTFLASSGPPQVGFGLAVALFASQLAASLAMNHYYATVMHATLGLKAGLVDMVYLKALRMSNAAKGDIGVGTIVNMLSNDVQKLWNFALYLHSAWSSPLQILVVVVLLIRILGIFPALAALATAFLLVPASSISGRYLRASRIKLMAFTDQRVKLTTEVLMGIKAIKLYAWEEPYVDRILAIRNKELRQIRISFLLNSVNNVIFLGGPIFIALVSFGTYAGLGNRLTAAVAFPALAYFNLLRIPLIDFPELIQQVINSFIAIKRIQGLLESVERTSNEEGPVARPGEIAVSVQDGRFSWGAGSEPVLEGVNLELAAGKLVMIIGEVGSGKSSLLSVILGEMHKHAGRVVVNGSIAYTAQDPWIQNATMRDNVLMGTPMQEKRYLQTVTNCAMGPDIAMLAAGDLTEIGEKGVNLSGGQKHRVALARAVYQDADVYLLDDPLSAVDAHVGRQLFDKVICGMLAGKSRLLVTHQVQYISGADLVVVVNGGKIAEVGTHQELVARGVDFSHFHIDVTPEEPEDATPALPPPPPTAGSSSDMASSSGALSDGGLSDTEDLVVIPDLKEAAGAKPAQQRLSVDGLTPMKAAASKTLLMSFDVMGNPEKPKTKKEMTEEEEEESGKLILVEERATGKVAWSMYGAYLRAWSPFWLLPITWATIAFGERALQTFQTVWLSIWTNSVAADIAAERPPRDLYYMYIYFVIGVLSVTLQYLREVSLVFGANNAARGLHSELLSKVVRLPMSFFDTQPTGRLLNRFSKDTEAVDLLVAVSFTWMMTCLTSVAGSIIVIASVTPYILLALFPLGVVYYLIQQRFVATSREVKRLDSLAFSPIFANFNETLVGLVTLRAFRKEQDFHHKNLDLLDSSNRCYWSQIMCNRWLSTRLEVLGAVITFATSIFVTVLLRRSAGVAGLALTSAMNLTNLLSALVRQTTELEVNMNGVERIVEYTTLEPEKAAIVPGKRPPASWPSQGAISVEGLWLRYRPELDPVLKGLTFSVQGREKIGVAGRTGCGKSTLMMALYRLVEPSGGRIVIDGVNILEIGLFDLRSKLALVPQDPVIFSGTVRNNLDPFGVSGGDDVIWESLRQAGMDGTIRGMEGGLDTVISEGGGNLSTGQRQLLCMARSLLRQSKILILDEATSNVDNTTDSLIQTTIRSAFKHCTTLTIAHRLHTIIDSDRVLVLEAGQVLEFDSPANLMKTPTSAFYSLVQSTKLANSH